MAIMISVVDDDASVRKALSRLCRAAGYETVAFASAEEFVASEQGSTSSCLILDVHLPGMNGLQLQQELRIINPTCRIIFITAFDDQQAREHAMSGGAVDFLNKPLDTQQLLDVISATVESQPL